MSPGVPTPPREPLYKSDCAFVARLLAHGPQRATFVEAEALRRGISYRRLRRARELLAIVSTPRMGPRGIECWLWSLPPPPAPKPPPRLDRARWAEVGIRYVTGPSGEQIVTHPDGDEYALDVLTGRVPFAEAVERERRAARSRAEMSPDRDRRGEYVEALTGIRRTVRSRR